jgi:hypothetical protein
LYKKNHFYILCSYNYLDNQQNPKNSPMKNLALLTITLLTLLMVSCSKDNVTTDFEYKGPWSGTYTGDGDSGTWSATINEDGTVTGSATSTGYGVTYNMSGTINSEGEFNATAGSVSTGTEFVGQFDGNSASGTWSNSTLQMSGTWTGTRSNM